jgi:hypothetical protein
MLKFLKNIIDIFGVDVTVPTRTELTNMGVLVSSVFYSNNNIIKMRFDSYNNCSNQITQIKYCCREWKKKNKQ